MIDFLLGRRRTSRRRRRQRDSAIALLVCLLLLAYVAASNWWGPTLVLALMAAGIGGLIWRYRKKLPVYKFAGRHWTNADLMTLSPAEFERFVAQVYRALGYRVKDNPYHGADGGVDLILERDGRRIVAQCKRWQGAVAVQPVRELWGVKHALAAEGAIFVTTGSFTTAAIKWAASLSGLELLDGQRLLQTVELLSERTGR